MISAYGQKIATMVICQIGSFRITNFQISVRKDKTEDLDKAAFRRRGRVKTIYICFITLLCN